MFVFAGTCLEDGVQFLSAEVSATDNGVTTMTAHPVALAAILWLVMATGGAAQTSTTEPPPGVPAPSETVGEIQRTVDDAIRRFNAMDSTGVLAHVSEQYRTTPFTKRVLADQLRAIFAVHDQVKATVRIDEIRMVGEHAWIFSTGDVTGRVRLLGTPVSILSWAHELEVARREGDRWRLFGYQQ
jgi:hypothetical protein